MGNFHRLIDPTYHLFAGESFAGPPTDGTIGSHTYSRMNVTATGTGAGAANMDARKSSGPNQYTEMVAFGEDATSSDMNRGYRALSENTDTIDDILRGAIPRLVDTPHEDTAVGTVVNIDITDDVFVSDNGDTTRPPGELAIVTDDSDRQLEVGGSPVVVTAVQQTGGGSSVIGTEADGFYTDPRVVVSPGIPNGTTFRVHYGERSTLARRVEIDKLSFFATQLGDAGNTALEEKIWAQGLNEKYRRSSKYPSSYNLDTAGDGAIIQRDGPAPEVVNNAVDYVTAPKQYQDPYLALWKAAPQELDQSGDVDYSGYVGYLALAPRQDTAESSSVEATARGLPAAGFMTAVPRDIRADTLNSKTTLTRIDSTVDVTLNPESGVGDDARVVELGTNEYFANASNDTAVRDGHDLLVLTWDTGLPTEHSETYVIANSRVTATNTNRRAHLRTLGGEKPTFANADTAKARWLQPTVVLGGAAADASAAGLEYGLGNFAVLAPFPLFEDPLNTEDPTPAFFSGWPYDRAVETSSADVPALTCGAFQPSTGTKFTGLKLYGDGDIVASRGRHSGSLESPGKGITRSIASAGTTNWDPMSYPSSGGVDDRGGSALGIGFTGAAAFVYTLALHSSYTPRVGDRLVLYVYNKDGATVTMNWPSSFIFSEGDDTIPVDAGYIAKYELFYADLSSFGGTDGFLVTKTAYDLSP